LPKFIAFILQDPMILPEYSWYMLLNRSANQNVIAYWVLQCFR